MCKPQQTRVDENTLHGTALCVAVHKMCHRCTLRKQTSRKHGALLLTCRCSRGGGDYAQCTCARCAMCSRSKRAESRTPLQKHLNHNMRPPSNHIWCATSQLHSTSFQSSLNSCLTEMLLCLQRGEQHPFSLRTASMHPPHSLRPSLPGHASSRCLHDIATTTE